jgi:hypothetical protein
MGYVGARDCGNLHFTVRIEYCGLCLRALVVLCCVLQCYALLFRCLACRAVYAVAFLSDGGRLAKVPFGLFWLLLGCMGPNILGKSFSSISWNLVLF